MTAYFALLGRMGIPSVHLVDTFTHGGWPAWSADALAVVAAPIVEETAFRASS